MLGNKGITICIYIPNPAPTPAYSCFKDRAEHFREPRMPCHACARLQDLSRHGRGVRAHRQKTHGHRHSTKQRYRHICAFACEHAHLYTHTHTHTHTQRNTTTHTQRETHTKNMHTLSQVPQFLTKGERTTLSRYFFTLSLMGARLPVS